MSRLRLSQPAMMILRSITRWPLRAATSALGLSMAVAVLTAASFFDDAMDKMIDTTFGLANRQDAVLMFTENRPEIVLDELRTLPGALQIEGQLTEPVVLRNGHLEKHTTLEARRSDADLSRIVGGSGRIIAAPPGGVVLAARLARQLGLAPGDTVEVDFLSGRRETAVLPVTATIDQYIGIAAYMDFGTLNALRRQAPQVSVANLTLDPAQATEFHRALAGMPALAGTAMVADMRRSFNETLRQNINITATVYMTIAVLITVGVTYNGARIQLSERARELASLRILGFSRGEVSLSSSARRWCSRFSRSPLAGSRASPSPGPSRKASRATSTRCPSSSFPRPSPAQASSSCSPRSARRWSSGGASTGSTSSR